MLRKKSYSAGVSVILYFVGVIFLLFLISYFFFPYIMARKYNNGDGFRSITGNVNAAQIDQAVSAIATSTASSSSVTQSSDQLKQVNQVVAEPAIPIVVTHIGAPQNIKSAYMTGWVAGAKEMREKEVNLITSTELNAVVIDIKDYTGRISYIPTDPNLLKIGSSDARIPDIRQFINELHQKGIYVIGRVATFQDPFFVKVRPDLAVKTKDGSAVWKDRKGISWLDAGAKDVWDYNIAIARDAYNQGFDEINFDYVRFPSDGDMTDISYPFSGKKAKPAVIKSFFSYLHDQLSGTGMKTSADLFGMTTTSKNDLGIGQVLENALPYFDYVDPMVIHHTIHRHFWDIKIRLIILTKL